VVESAVDVRFTWPTVRPPRQDPAYFTVIQREFAHDMLVLTFYREPHAVERFKEGTPLAVEWGYANQTDTFYGTVLYIQPNVENENHVLRVVCVGASYPFKETAPEVYRDVRLDQIIAREMRTARLALISQSTKTVWPMLTRHAQETQWEFYVRLAKRVGYTWFVNKVTAHCYDPVKWLNANENSHPVLRYVYEHGNAFAGEVITFTPLLGDQGVPDQEHREQRLMTVDPRSRAVIGAANAGDGTTLTDLLAAPPKFTEFITAPAHTIGEARTRVNGMTGEQRWRNRATAECRGNARIRQGMGVIIEGVSADSDGVWYVTGVRHVVTKEKRPRWQYYATLDLVRDGTPVQRLPVGRRRPLRAEVHTGSRVSNPRVPTGVWDGSRWVAKETRQVVLA
jgi:hypothetical protein